MFTLLSFVAVTALVVLGIGFGAYKAGTRSQWWGIVLAPFLLRASLFALKVGTDKPGEGAASGVAVVMLLGWLVAIVCVIVTVALLAGAVIGQKSWLGGVVLLLGVVPFGIKLAGHADSSKERGEVRAELSPEQRRANGVVEGYAWAIDNGVRSVEECSHRTPEFSEGCKRALAEHAPQVRSTDGATMSSAAARSRNSEQSVTR